MNITRVLQTISNKLFVKNEITQGLATGFVSTTLISGSISGIYSYKMDYNKKQIIKNIYKGTKIGAYTFIMSPILFYQIFENYNK